jgi:glycerol-3-phosphate cytidylyltransferase
MSGKQLKNRKMEKAKTIYVIGVFDLFHSGHVKLLERAKALGDRLIVAVNGDDMVASYKRRPFFGESDRLLLIASCRYVDEAFIIREYDNKTYLEKYGVDVVVHGDDWGRASYLEQIRVDEAFMKAHGIELCLLPYTTGVSTSDLIKKIKASE